MASIKYFDIEHFNHKKMKKYYVTVTGDDVTIMFEPSLEKTTGVRRTLLHRCIIHMREKISIETNVWYVPFSSSYNGALAEELSKNYYYIHDVVTKEKLDRRIEIYKRNMQQTRKKMDQILTEITLLSAFDQDIDMDQDMAEIISELRNEDYTDAQIQEWLNDFIKNPPEYIKTLSLLANKYRKYV